MRFGSSESMGASLELCRRFAGQTAKTNKKEKRIESCIKNKKHFSELYI